MRIINNNCVDDKENVYQHEFTLEDCFNIDIIQRFGNQIIISAGESAYSVRTCLLQYDLLSNDIIDPSLDYRSPSKVCSDDNTLFVFSPVIDEEGNRKVSLSLLKKTGHSEVLKVCEAKKFKCVTSPGRQD